MVYDSVFNHVHGGFSCRQSVVYHLLDKWDPYSLIFPHTSATVAVWEGELYCCLFLSGLLDLEVCPKTVRGMFEAVDVGCSLDMVEWLPDWDANRQCVRPRSHVHYHRVMLTCSCCSCELVDLPGQDWEITTCDKTTLHHHNASKVMKLYRYDTIRWLKSRMWSADSSTSKLSTHCTLKIYTRLLILIIYIWHILYVLNNGVNI